MTNLDSILKSRDITLPTKVSLVKAMAAKIVFPSVSDKRREWTENPSLLGRNKDSVRSDWD